MSPSRRDMVSQVIEVSGVALVVGMLAACNDSLVDHAAGAVLQPSCGAGEVACGGVCVAEDAGHCGAACDACAPPADPNGAPVCTEAHACAFRCDPGWLRVGGTCERAVTVSAGFAHTCAITASGAVKCWGSNDHGQLGDGSGEDSSVPVDVTLPGPASAIAAGYVHTCAVVAGTVYCWGDNATGALGDGTTTQRTSPVRVPGLSGVAAVAAGGGEDTGPVPTFYGHSCALASGSVSCWGSNESGQLGDGTFTQRAIPVRVALGAADGRVSAIANGDRHTCAVADGAVWCWGAAGSWQLGSGGTSNQPRPVRAQGVVAAVAVAAGAAHTCAVVTGAPSAVACWGSNSAGQATGGDNALLTVQQPFTVPIEGVSPNAVAAGNAHTCVAGDPAGAVACFGANDASQLSGAATARGSMAVQLPRPARSIAAGYDHTCAVLDDGSIECWGANASGQLGVGVVGAPAGVPSTVSGR